MAHTAPNLAPYPGYPYTPVVFTPYVPYYPLLPYSTNLRPGPYGKCKSAYQSPVP